MTPESRPNILLIMTDQQSSWTLGCYGGHEITTPNIDRLANEGVRFSNFFTNSACCTPSRGCFFTGLYPHQHGAHFNDLPLRQDVTTVAQQLADHGYETGYIGKWHLNGDWDSLKGACENGGISLEELDITADSMISRERDCWVAPDRSMGFHDCRWMFNCSHSKHVIEQADGTIKFGEGIGEGERYTTDWLTSRAIDFVQQDREHPFFLTLSIPDPHDPFCVRAPFDTMFHPDDMTIPKTFHEQTVPDWLQSKSVTMWHRPPGVVGTEDALRRAKANYLGEVACIDYNVGRLIAALGEHKDILDDTIVIFTTDHGEYMGEHGIYAKNCLYESAYRIPFIARFPSRIPAGHTVDAFVTAVDFQQTLLGMVGVPPCGDEQGWDLSPLLRGELGPQPNEAFIYGTVRNAVGIFTPDYELAYIKGAKDHILFDRRNDPFQQHNLFSDPSYSEVVAELTGQILRHNRRIDAPEVEWLAPMIGNDPSAAEPQ